VKALWSTIDSKGGVHRAYGETNESMGSEATVDAQAKDSSYYSKETITVKGYTDTKSSGGTAIQIVVGDPYAGQGVTINGSN
jgi:outer membrane protein OmpA-like peptidoglycan-associated protein